MQNSKIIDLNSYLPARRPEQSDHAAHETRAEGRCHRTADCAVVLTAVESIVTVLIGLCVLASTVVFFTIL